MGIFLVIMLVIIVFCIYMAVMTSNAQNQRRDDAEQKKLQHSASAFAQLLLVSGLPLAEKTCCSLFVNEDKLIIEAENQTFQIDINRIIAAQPKTDLEIQQEVTSSAGKAIAGALIFGPVGAIIGARTKTKKHAVVSTYLIINYINQSGDTAVLAFESANSAILKALNDKIQGLRAGSVTNL